MTAEQIETGSKKVRGRARRSIDLIEAMYTAAEAAQPITGRGIGYKLFSQSSFHRWRDTKCSVFTGCSRRPASRA